MLSIDCLPTAGLEIHSIRAARRRRIIDRPWMVPEEIQASQKPDGSKSSETEENEKLEREEVGHAA